MKVKNALVWFILLFVFSNCKNKSLENNEVFDRYYLEFQKNNHSGYDSLLAYYHRLDSVSYTKKSDLLFFLRITTKARLYFREADYASSNKNYVQANGLIIGINNTDSLLAMNYLGMGINYMNMGVFDSAFSYYGKALVIYDSIQNKKMSHVVQANMAQAYYNKLEPEKALSIIGKLTSEKAAESIYLSTLHLKANILGSSGKLDSAILLDRQIINKYGNNRNNYLISSFYNNLGMCYLEKGQVDTAIYYCNKSYEIDSLSGIKMNMGANLVLLGDISKQTNNKKAATSYYLKALNIFSEDSNIDKKFWIYQTLAKNAKKDNDLSQAIVYQDSMLSTYRKMNNLNVNRTIELLKIEYETDKKNQQIENQNARLKGQRIAIMLTLVISLLLISALYFFFQNRDKKNKLRIAEQDKKVSAMLVEAEQNERSRIARDLHDSVSQKLAVMQMHLSVIETTQTESVNNINYMLQQAISDVRGISHNLYPKDLEKGIIPAIERLCEQNNFINADIKFSLKTDDSIISAGLSKNIELVIYRIVQEITNNALKYSKANKVVIELAIKNGKISIQIADDGVGFNTSDLETAKGIGLKNIIDRIKQISGNITIHSKEQEGTRFFIEIPA